MGTPRILHLKVGTIMYLLTLKACTALWLCQI